MYSRAHCARFSEGESTRRSRAPLPMKNLAPDLVPTRTGMKLERE